MKKIITIMLLVLSAGMLFSFSPTSDLSAATKPADDYILANFNGVIGAEDDNGTADFGIAWDDIFELMLFDEAEYGLGRPLLAYIYYNDGYYHPLVAYMDEAGIINFIMYTQQYNFAFSLEYSELSDNALVNWQNMEMGTGQEFRLEFINPTHEKALIINSGSGIYGRMGWILFSDYEELVTNGVSNKRAYIYDDSGELQSVSDYGVPSAINNNIVFTPEYETSNSLELDYSLSNETVSEVTITNKIGNGTDKLIVIKLDKGADDYLLGSYDFVINNNMTTTISEDEIYEIFYLIAPVEPNDSYFSFFTKAINLTIDGKRIDKSLYVITCHDDTPGFVVFDEANEELFYIYRASSGVIASVLGDSIDITGEIILEIINPKFEQVIRQIGDSNGDGWDFRNDLDNLLFNYQDKLAETYIDGELSGIASSIPVNGIYYEFHADDFSIELAAGNGVPGGAYVNDLTFNEGFYIRIVLPDTDAPVITGATDTDYVIGERVPDYLAGVTASDILPGLRTLAVDSSDVDLTKPGEYELIYTATDYYGNESTKTVTVTVISNQIDITAPVISGAKNITYRIGDTLPNYSLGVTATDDIDGEVTVIIDSSDVDLTNPGEYELIYTATDEAGNVARKTVTVFVIKPGDKDPNTNTEVPFFEWDLGGGFLMWHAFLVGAAAIILLVLIFKRR